MKNVESIYKLGQKVGLNEKDIDDIIKNNVGIEKQSYLSTGPGPYLGTWYGTLSIKDF